MRNIIVAIAAIAFSIPCYSQDPKDPVDYSEKRNEINIGFFNAFELNTINELGIGYKYSTEKGALRLATGFSLGTQESEGEQYQHNYSDFGISPRVGYEFHQNFNRLRLYYGVDFVTSFYKSVSEHTYVDPATPSTEIRTYKNSKVGLRPILGLTVFLTNSISLSTETYLNLLVYKTTHEWDNSDDLSTDTSKGIDTGLGPLGIVSVNFHF